MDDVALLEIKNVTVKFPGIIALDDVSLSVRSGSVHAIVGENGAGKSTLMKVLIGDIIPNSGKVLFEGRPIEKSAKSGKHKNVSMIYQELNPIKDMTVAENVLIGRLPERARGFVDTKKMFDICQQIFDDWDLPFNPRQPMRTLSIGGMQMIEIIKAVSSDSRIIIMDEPSSAITTDETRKLFQFIRQLKSRDVTIIYISHKLDEIYEIADSVTIIRDGKKISEHPIGEITRDEMITDMVGRSIDSVYYRKSAPAKEPLLEVKGLGRSNKVADVTFTLRSGEVLGFAGIMGAGRTETMRCIFGLDRADKGRLLLNGKPISIKRPADAINAGIAMLTEDRKGDGLILCRSVAENISLAVLKRFSKFGFLKKGLESRSVDAMLSELAIKVKTQSSLVNSLSGGNQQKVVLARWLLKKPRVLILDEPTRGIDVGAKAEIYHIIGDLAERGVGIIIVSSDLPEVLGVSDRIAVMESGRLKGVLDHDEATQEKIMEMATMKEAANG